MTLAEARQRLVEAEGRLARANVVQGDAMRIAVSARSALRAAEVTRRTHTGLLMSMPGRTLSLAAARDAYATAQARVKRADADVRAARRDVEAARTELDLARDALVQQAGGWDAYARGKLAEAAQLESMAQEARREAALCESRDRRELTFEEVMTIRRRQAQQGEIQC